MFQLDLVIRLLAALNARVALYPRARALVQRRVLGDRTAIGTIELGPRAKASGAA